MDQEYLERIINRLFHPESYLLIQKQWQRERGPTLITPLESAGVDLYDWIEN